MKQKLLLLIMLGLCARSVMAFELFGVNVNNTTREQLRAAIRNTGVVVEREAGDQNWFDIYDASPVFKQSQRLYVSYDKRSGKFAFAEYQLPLSYVETMVLRLKLKYGTPRKKYGTFSTDTSYYWESDGIKISLVPYWKTNSLQLLYVNPQAMRSLSEDYQKFRQTELSRVMQADASYY